MISQVRVKGTFQSDDAAVDHEGTVEVMHTLGRSSS
jgi:hypothetical protein